MNKGKLTYRAMTTTGAVVKVVVECTLEDARWMANRGIFFSGVWETCTNRIYL